MAFGKTNNVVPLFLQGPVGTGVPLSVAGPISTSGVATLFTQGPDANELTLFIGKEIDASGIVPLYIQSPFATGAPGTTLEQNLTSLSVLGTSFDEENRVGTLSISAPSIGSGVKVSTLFVQVDAPSADGTVPVSGLMTISVQGNNPAAVGEGHNKDTTLFIRVQEVQNSGMPIYIEKPTVGTIPLTITSQISSGVLPVAISGMFTQTGITTLHISPPATSFLNTTIRGFLE